jgi:hypothetical protein
VGKTRQSGRKKQPKPGKPSQNGNLTLLKVIDPAVQSLLFILLIYNIGTDTGAVIRKHFYLVFGWQLLSSFMNFFVKSVTLLMMERLFFLASVLLCAFLFVLYRKHTTYVTRWSGMSVITFYDIIMLSLAIGAAFWYFLICFREARSLLKTTIGND